MTDPADLARDALARSGSLDAFMRCSVDGCEVRVHLSCPPPIKCRLHGGPKVAQYESSATDSAFIWAAYLTRTGDIDAGGDCE